MVGVDGKSEGDHNSTDSDTAVNVEVDSRTSFDNHNINSTANPNRVQDTIDTRSES